jgi:succinoglycan biosynthesis protein ExoU
MPSATICVIIAAKNAEATIGRAIASALREPLVDEVIVVDDGSDDATARVSRDAGDSTGRLQVIALERNQGPAFARNQAIARSRAPLVAILDADDFFLQGRFDTLLDGGDWDFVADNIVFIDSRSAACNEPEVPRFEAAPRFLDLPGFIEGNISRRGASRGEIGFLKPVMRRAFLDAHGLRYDETLRLGEDSDLYARALLRGARYKVVHGCGYGAVVRADSLSGRHRTADLKRLYEADRAMLTSGAMTAEARTALRRHERHVRGRYELRHFLDRKAESGLAVAGLQALMRPAALPAIIRGVAADKFHAFTRRDANTEPASPRYLLPASVSAHR